MRMLTGCEDVNLYSVNLAEAQWKLTTLAICWFCGYGIGKMIEFQLLNECFKSRYQLLSKFGYFNSQRINHN